MFHFLREAVGRITIEKCRPLCFFVPSEWLQRWVVAGNLAAVFNVHLVAVGCSCRYLRHQKSGTCRVALNSHPQNFFKWLYDAFSWVLGLCRFTCGLDAEVKINAAALWLTGSKMGHRWETRLALLIKVAAGNA